MKRLTLEERARRNATRKNNQSKKQYPLVPEQFAVEAEAERLQRLEVSAAEGLARIKQFNLESAGHAAELRNAVREHVSADVLAQLDAKLEKLYGGRGAYSAGAYKGAEWADFWWQAVKQYAPDYAQANCPNSFMHSERMYQRQGYCPTCRLPLITPAEEEVVVISQPGLFDQRQV
jgi:hypothetical protein